MRERKPIIERLWSRTTLMPSGCLEWNGGTDTCGYGLIHLGAEHGRTTSTHRAAWELLHGDIPTGKVVRHRCNNRRCINPAHLLIGTVNDNNQDKARAGRAPKKLSADEVIEIRHRYASGGETLRSLAADFGVHNQCIHQVVRERTHKYIGGVPSRP